ncbi:DUF4434 domain-containing protein [Ruthenibacterium sp. CLA-JM-H11]|uniref:DUF4434 domain-containing protein n=1 Tax=Ruthenibacterium intestinale TaxID=3133163 RepID=A0ABV1GE21_9FIRM
MVRLISGSWFEFQHHNQAEGKYWNPICRHFSEEQWREKIREMHSLGMKYIVLLCSSLVDEDFAEAYFPTDIYPLAKDFVCQDPIDALMSEAEKLDMKVFMSVGYYGPWNKPRENMVSPSVTQRAFKAMEQVYGRYGKYRSFYGWYYPDESCITKYFDDNFAAYVNQYSAFGKSFNSNLKTMIAPYGTNMLSADDVYVRQLETLDVDIVAYQDEVGVRKSTPDQTGRFYSALKKAHDKAGRSKLWADVELFEFEGDVYHSALLPSNMERLKRQLEAVSFYVEEVLGYQYMGLMNRPGTIAYCGHPDSVAFYVQYKKFMEQQGSACNTL